MNTYQNGNHSIGVIGNDYSGSISMQNELDYVARDSFGFATAPALIEASRRILQTLGSTLSMIPFGRPTHDAGDTSGQQHTPRGDRKEAA